MNYLNTLNNIIFYGSHPLKNIKNRIKYDYKIKYNEIVNFSYCMFESNNNIFYEINLDEINAGRNYILLKFFDTFFKNKSIKNNKKNIIIYNFDLLNNNEQYNILFLMENYKNVKFIFCVKNINKILEQIKTRCKNIRIKSDYSMGMDIEINKKLTYSNITKFVYNSIEKYNINFEEFILIITKKLLKNNSIDKDKLLDESLELCYNMNLSNKKIFYIHKFIYKYRVYL